VTDDTLRRVDALIQVGLRIARSAPSGRIALARLAAAVDPAWLPRPWGDSIIAELDAAAAQAREPIASEHVERILAEAWDADPAEELDELDPEPVAVTPGAQVHRGVLEGKRVAVKVLRPGLAAAVRQDLSLLEGLAAPLASAFPAVNPAGLLAEIRERVLDELDLEHEAQAQRRLHRALRGHPFLTVPAPVTRLSHEAVLVSEWVDGVPIAESSGRDDAAAKLVLFAIGSARAGIIHADIDPNDVLVLEGGRIAILDFGATRTVEADRIDASARALEALIACDERAFAELVEKLGWVRAGRVGIALSLARHALGPFIQEAGAQTLDVAAVVDVGRRLGDKREAIAEIASVGALAPEDLWPARGLGQLFGTIARVGATGPWRELVRTALRDGFDARPIRQVST
jgi:predicted unusual protein kinase regulating ubiquinone biosynthesis (AarF/ABC1/UbiB family)